MKEFTVDETITGRITNIRDAHGNPATIDGVFEWEADSDTVTLESAEDGLSCKVVPGDAVDDVINVKARGDADLGEGTKPIIVVFEPLVLKGGPATVVEAAWGEPEPKGEPGPGPV